MMTMFFGNRIFSQGDSVRPVLKTSYGTFQNRAFIECVFTPKYGIEFYKLHNEENYFSGLYIIQARMLLFEKKKKNV